jgi:hypothetical protein
MTNKCQTGLEIMSRIYFFNKILLINYLIIRETDEIKHSTAPEY